jgi:hypothetical protein
MALTDFAGSEVGDKLRFVEGPFKGEEVTVVNFHNHYAPGSHSMMACVTRSSGELSGGWFPYRFEKVADAWVPKFPLRSRVRVVETILSGRKGVVTGHVCKPGFTGYGVMLDGLTNVNSFYEKNLEAMPDEEYNVFRVGDRVRLAVNARGPKNPLYGRIGTITSFTRDVTGIYWVNVDFGDGVPGGWSAESLEKVEEQRAEQDKKGENMPNTSPDNNAMTFAEAAAQLQVLIKAGIKGGIIRQRSWDKGGVYGAIEVGGTKLYTPAKVADYIKAQQPVDAVGVQYADHYLFKEREGNYLRGPGGSTYWNLADIVHVGGVATGADGTRYRLCRNVPTPFLPFLDEKK